MRAKPVVLGHEVALTVVGVGENLKDKFHVGERYLIQADIYVGGKTFAYGYVLQGGLSQYNVLGQEVLNGDDGCYLLPIHGDLSYAAVALTEPWACVEAAYHNHYRTTWQKGGVVWVMGTAPSQGRSYSLSHVWAEQQEPRLIIASDLPLALEAELHAQARSRNIPLLALNGLHAGSFERAMAETAGEGLDDIVVLGADAEIVERALSCLRRGGMLNLVADSPLARPVQVDVGRIHYDHLAIVGTTASEISRAYQPIRTQLKAGGKALGRQVDGGSGHLDDGELELKPRVGAGYQNWPAILHESSAS